MKKLLVGGLILICAGLAYGVEGEGADSTSTGGEISVSSSSGTMSKGDSFLAAFGMGDSSVGGGDSEGGDTGGDGSGTGGSSSSTAGAAAIATTTGTVTSSQGTSPVFTPYTYTAGK